MSTLEVALKLLEKNSNEINPNVNKTAPVITKSGVANIVQNSSKLGKLQIEKETKVTFEDKPNTPTERTPGNKKIIGNNSNKDRSETLTAVKKRAWLYVGKIDPKHSEADLLRYLQGKFVNRHFDVEKLTKIDNAHSVAFRVGIDFDLLDDVYKPDMWPNDVVIKRYFFRQRRVDEPSK